jgi:flagellar protein FlaG
MTTDIARIANAPSNPIASLREASPSKAGAPSLDRSVKPEPKPVSQFDAETQRKNLQKTLEELNNQMKQTGRNLNFKMDDALQMPIVTVTNSQTGEVIRQIPNEVVVRVAHNLQDLKGMLLNEKI